MELRHLRYFKAVAEELNFSRAAAKLRVAQPALSRQVRALEEELGAPLFTRDRGVHLTDGGRVFYAHASKVLAQVDIGIAAFREAATGSAGELVVCNDWRLSGHFLPEIVREFHAAFPRAEITLQDMRVHEQLAAVRSRRAHVGFIVRSLFGPQRELDHMLVLRSRIMVLLSAKHPRAGAREIALADLAKERWVILDEDDAPGYRTFLLQLCRLAGFVPPIAKIATTMEGLVGRVAAGYGVAALMETAAPASNRLVRVLPLNVEPLELCAIWHRRETSPLLHAFLDLVRTHVNPDPVENARPTRGKRVTAVVD